MQNPNEDTRWNDALRRHGIIPEKEVTEEQIVSYIDEIAQKRLEPQTHSFDGLDLEGLKLLEDEEDERVLLNYRRKRMAEVQLAAQRAKFGDIRDISAIDWVEQVNKAGDNITVIVLLTKNGLQLCSLINEHFRLLAAKFPHVKFVRGQADCCLPNFPENHLPCVMVYRDGKLIHKFVGSEPWGNRPTADIIEWILSKEAGAFETELEEDPRPRTRDVLMDQLLSKKYRDSDSDE